MKASTKLGVCPSNFPALASKSVPLRAPASPAQSVRGEASEGGQSPPPSYLGCRGQVPEKDLPPAARRFVDGHDDGERDARVFPGEHGISILADRVDHIL